ncbi:MAG: hypothetical protein ACXW39_07095, partial [Nitrospira sp.]
MAARRRTKDEQHAGPGRQENKGGIIVNSGINAAFAHGGIHDVAACLPTHMTGQFVSFDCPFCIDPLLI